MRYLTHVTSSRQQLTTTQVREITKNFVISQGRPVCDERYAFRYRIGYADTLAEASARWAI